MGPGRACGAGIPGSKSCSKVSKLVIPDLAGDAKMYGSSGPFFEVTSIVRQPTWWPIMFSQCPMWGYLSRNRSNSNCVPAPGNCPSGLRSTGVGNPKVNRSGLGFACCIPAFGRRWVSPGYVGLDIPNLRRPSPDPTGSVPAPVTAHGVPGWEATTTRVWATSVLPHSGVQIGAAFPDWDRRHPDRRAPGRSGHSRVSGPAPCQPPEADAAPPPSPRSRRRIGWTGLFCTVLVVGLLPAPHRSSVFFLRTSLLTSNFGLQWPLSPKYVWFD